MPAGGSTHYICITNAYSFVNDSFDFNGKQFLGFWDFENYDFSPIDFRKTKLNNEKFTSFSQRMKYGRDFRTVSPLYEIPKAELEFTGKEIIDGDICWKVTR